MSFTPWGSVGSKGTSRRLSEATLQDCRALQRSTGQRLQAGWWPRPERSRTLHSAVSTRDIRNKVGGAAGGPLSGSMLPCLFMASPLLPSTGWEPTLSLHPSLSNFSQLSRPSQAGSCCTSFLISSCSVPPLSMSLQRLGPLLSLLLWILPSVVPTKCACSWSTVIALSIHTTLAPALPLSEMGCQSHGGPGPIWNNYRVPLSMPSDENRKSSVWGSGDLILGPVLLPTC